MFFLGGKWQCFSDIEKRIVDLGENEDAAREEEKKHIKKISPGEILKRTEPSLLPGKENAETGGTKAASDGTSSGGSPSDVLVPAKQKDKPGQPTLVSGQNASGASISAGQLQTVAAEPKKYKLSPKLAAKIQTAFAGTAASTQITATEILIKVFGYEPGEIDGEDSDAELLKLAWEAQMEIWCQGDSIPPWLLIAGAHLSIIARQISGAKKREKKENGTNGTDTQQ